MNFTSAEEFELHVHKCFGRIFELLQKIDAVAKEGADREEQQRNWGVMTDLRDWVEDAILYSHLAWQYHRLAMGPRKMDTWERMRTPENNEQPKE